MGGEPASGRVVGIGGVFLRARDPDALGRWYREHIGLTQGPDSTDPMVVFEGGGADAGSTTWALFPADTDYFGPSGQSTMVNYRVDHLDAILARLRAAGVQVDEHVEEMEYGRFGWAVDPEGNRFEVWEPAKED